MRNLSRITFDPNVMGGKPCIRGLRVTVGAVVGLVATVYPVKGQNTTWAVDVPL